MIKWWVNWYQTNKRRLNERITWNYFFLVFLLAYIMIPNDGQLKQLNGEAMMILNGWVMGSMIQDGFRISQLQSGWEWIWPFFDVAAQFEELTHFPTDPYHEFVGSDEGRHESVGSDITNHELVGSDRS